MTFSEAIKIVLNDCYARWNPTYMEACEVIASFMESWGDAIKDMEQFGMHPNRRINDDNESIHPAVPERDRPTHK